MSDYRSQDGALREMAALAAFWLEPISEGEPAGALAEHEPAYEAVSTEIRKLESVSGEPVDWQIVVESGSQVLQTLSKDLGIACRVAFGLQQTEGLDGCVRGLAMVAELTDRYWDNLFPSIRRVRGRAGTLNWLAEKLEPEIGSLQPDESDRADVALLTRVVQRLEEVIGARFSDTRPSLSPLLRGLERLQLSLPPGLDSPADAPAVQADSEVQATSPAADMEAAFFGGAPLDPPTSADPGIEPEPESGHRELVAHWLQPISPEAPAGIDAKYEASYESVMAEIAHLGAIDGRDILWKKIVEESSEILVGISKDLIVATYLTAGWFELEGLAGLQRGLALLTELVRDYWEDMFPPLRRIRARSRIFTWLLERLEGPLSDFVPTESDRGDVEALDEISLELDAIIKERFEGEGPVLNPLLRCIKRLQLTLSELDAAAAARSESQSAPAQHDGAAEQGDPSMQAPPQQSAGASAPQTTYQGAAPAKFESGQDPSDYLLDIGKSLVITASDLFEENAMDPLPYRLAREGTWLYLSSEPSANASGKTEVPAYSAGMQSTLEESMSAGHWGGLLQETEGAIWGNRYWLDLHRYSATALASMGPEYVGARQSVIDALGSFLRRLPNLLTMSFEDGTPFADAATRDWIAEEVLLAEASEGGQTEAADEETAACLEEARALVKAGKATEAIDLLQTSAEGQKSRRQRFRLRLVLAKTCIGAGQMTLAKAVYEDLHREAQSRGLAQWDPALAITVLEGYFSVIRSLARGGKEVGATADTLFEQLCVLNPALAMKLDND